MPCSPEDPPSPQDRLAAREEREVCLTRLARQRENGLSLLAITTSGIFRKTSSTASQDCRDCADRSQAGACACSGASHLYDDHVDGPRYSFLDRAILKLARRGYFK